MTDQLAQSRSVLDFFIAMMMLSVALVGVAVTVSVWAGEAVVLLWLLLLIALIPVWYERAIAAVGWYRQAMQALVDLGRIPLAEQLGIRLSGDLEEERIVWQAVSNYAAWGPNWGEAAKWVARINEALVERGGTPSTGQANLQVRGTDDA